MTYIDENDLSIYYLYLINSLFIHYVMIWPIVGRMYYISVCIKFNYNFLTQKVYPNYLQYENDLNLLSKIYTENRTLYQTKVILFPLCILFFILILLSVIPVTRCALYAFHSYLFIINTECHKYITENMIEVLSSIKVVIDQSLIFILVSLLYLVFRYPVKNDVFKLKIELAMVFMIWYIFHNIYHGYLLFELKSINFFLTYMINVIEDLSLMLLYIYLTIMRKRVKDKDFYVTLYNYDLFMQNPICFNFLKDYIKKFTEEEYSHLFFFLHYHLFKKKYFALKYDDNVEFANVLYYDFFVQEQKVSTNSRISSASKSCSNKAKVNLFIEFPCDIFEKLEDMSNRNFYVENELLYEAFDEAYEYVNNKLYNRYLTMFRNEEEYKKLEKLICYIDFNLSEREDMIHLNKTK